MPSSNSYCHPTCNLMYIFLSNRVYPTRNNNLISDLNVRTDILSAIYKHMNSSGSQGIKPLIAVRSAAVTPEIITGAAQTDRYLQLLTGKRIGIVANQTSVIGKTSLIDSLKSLGVNIVKIFGPEHGFRGTASAELWLPTASTRVQVFVSYHFMEEKVSHLE